MAKVLSAPAKPEHSSFADVISRSQGADRHSCWCVMAARTFGILRSALTGMEPSALVRFPKPDHAELDPVDKRATSRGQRAARGVSRSVRQFADVLASYRSEQDQRIPHSA
jgi:hypothetical protein